MIKDTTDKKEEEPELVRDLTGGGTLDHRKLDRISQNPFIVNDGVLPPAKLRVTRTYLNTFEKHSKGNSKNNETDSPIQDKENVEFENVENNDNKENINDTKQILDTSIHKIETKNNDNITNEKKRITIKS
eukprot:783384_1